MCWEYFYPGKSVPIGIRWISKYDIWQWMEDDRILPYHYGLLTEYTVCKSDIWYKIFNEDFNHLMEMIKEKLLKWYRYKGKFRFSEPTVPF